MVGKRFLISHMVMNVLVCLFSFLFFFFFFFWGGGGGGWGRGRGRGGEGGRAKERETRVPGMRMSSGKLPSHLSSNYLDGV